MTEIVSNIALCIIIAVGTLIIVTAGLTLCAHMLDKYVDKKGGKK